MTGHRKTQKNYADGTTIIVEDQDFRSLRDPNNRDARLRTGATVYTLSPLPEGSFASAGPKAKAGPQAFAKAKARSGKIVSQPGILKAARRIVSKRPPSAPPIDPPVSSRGGEKKKELAKIDRSDVVRSDDTERSVQDRLRSLTKLDTKMLEELVRLFHTPDQMTGWKPSALLTIPSTFFPSVHCECTKR